MEYTGFSSPLRPFLTIILSRRFFLSAMGILFVKRARDRFENVCVLLAVVRSARPLVEDLGPSKRKEKFLRLTRMVVKDKMVKRWYTDGTHREYGIKIKIKFFCVLLGWYSEKRWCTDGTHREYGMNLTIFENASRALKFFF